MKMIRKIMIFLAVVSLLSYVPLPIGMTGSYGTITTVEAAAAKTPKLNITSAKVYVGESFKIKVSNAASNVKWSTSTKNKKAQYISWEKSGSKNQYLTVTPKKTGKVAFYAKVNGKTLKCTLTVVAKPKLNATYVNTFIGESFGLYAHNIQQSSAYAPKFVIPSKYESYLTIKQTGSRCVVPI